MTPFANDNDVSPSGVSTEPYHMSTKQSRRQTSKQVKRQAVTVKVTDLNTMVQIRKKAAPKTYKDKLAFKAEKQRQDYLQKVNKIKNEDKMKAPDTVLTGFILLDACNCKLPHDAKSGKLASQRITDVKEEDLAYFKKLEYLDL